MLFGKKKGTIKNEGTLLTYSVSESPSFGSDYFHRTGFFMNGVKITVVDF